MNPLSNYLTHHGILGQKWGVRRTPAQLGYSSTGIKSAIAKKKNAKVDEGFKNWNENVKKRDNAISLGKRATAAKRASESDPKNKDLKSESKQATKAYKKALGENTTYRKGVVKQEVGRDSARKYLSEAKKVKKQLDADPTNKALKKKYAELMSKHDVERADARRAVEVSSKRMHKKAALKRAVTMSVKAAATTAAVGTGIYAVNRYLTNGNLNINSSQVVDWAKKAKNAMGYFY